METVLFFLILHIAGSLIAQVFQDLGQRGPEILGRYVCIGPAAEFRHLDIAPVSQVEGGTVAVGGNFGGVEVFLPQFPDVLFRAEYGGNEKLIGIQTFRNKGIPEVQADYIFASWAEAMGLGGVICYFTLLGFFIWRGVKIAVSCKNRFAAFASFGFVVIIALQSLINCAVVCGALPSTGIPLPFFSLGGSSIIISLCMCGFVVNASRCDTEEDYNSFENDFVEIESIDGVKVYE